MIPVCDTVLLTQVSISDWDYLPSYSEEESDGLGPIGKQSEIIKERSPCSPLAGKPDLIWSLEG